MLPVPPLDPLVDIYRNFLGKINSIILKVMSSVLYSAIVYPTTTFPNINVCLLLMQLFNPH